MLRRSRNLAMLTFVGVLITSSGCQVPKQPVTTVWQKVGITQGWARLRDASLNRRGNHPGMEKKPPLLALADPANLESPIKALSAAAEIKMAEDLKPQKIKAIKYLASIGCGCYDKDGAIEAAFLEMLEDCTEEVRLEAVKGIAEAAGTCKCKYDGCTPTCCKPKIFKKLYAMAHEVDEDGCPIEPSAEVRKAAAKAVCACAAAQPTGGEVIIDDEDEETEDDDSEILPAAPAEEDLETLPGEPVSVGTESNSVALDVSTEMLQPAAMPAPVLVAPQSYEAPASEEKLFQPVIINAPAGMVEGAVVKAAEGGRIAIKLPQEFDLEAGDSILIMTQKKQTGLGTMVESDGSYVLVQSEDIENLKISDGQTVFLGLVAE